MTDPDENEDEDGSEAEEVGEAGQELGKKVILHLKQYDTSPLSCTVIFMYRKIGEPAEKIHGVVEELESEGIIGPWSEWKKGAVTPYKITNLPNLIDQGASLSYEEIQTLTGPVGGFPKDAPERVASGLAGSSRDFMYSQWAEENLKKMSEKLKSLNLADAMKLDKGAGEDYYLGLSYDLELGYLNSFFKSLFVLEDTDPLYVLYAQKDEDLPTFRKRTITSLLRALSTITEYLLKKIDQGNRPADAYILFFASILDRYTKLAQDIGAPAKETEKMKQMWDAVMQRTGGTQE